MVEILTKTCFLLKVSHIQLNYPFLIFSSIFVEIHKELLYLVQKVTISKKGQKYSKSLFFLTSLKMGNPEENLDLFKQLFLIKPVKW